MNHIVSELDYRSHEQIYADELKYRGINPAYGSKEDDNNPITNAQLNALEKIIEIAEQEHVIQEKGFTIKSFVKRVYEVNELKDITQGVYRDRVMSFVLLHLPYLWMTIPEKQANSRLLPDRDFYNEKEREA